MEYLVDLKNVQKILKKLPKHILKKLHFWTFYIEKFGLEETRKIKGLHDEALKGKRKGQRSLRLSKSYRVIYMQRQHKDIIILDVIEVNKHEYS